MHPADEIKGVKSSILKNKRIILAVTGSIAAVETVKLARELIRHGAEIIPVMTDSATKIVHPDALWFATGKKPIINLTGETEHVKYAGKTKKPADLILICPCTANTISKIAHAIDDTAVTTFATTAIGSKIPVIIVPAMHLSMYDHKIVQENIKKLKKNNIKILAPRIDKNKAKMPEIDEIIAYIIRQTNKQSLKNKKILIIGGPSVEEIDDIRILTNKSSGKTAITIAKNAFFKGAVTTLWYGRGKEKIPTWIDSREFFSIKNLLDLVKTDNIKNFDIIINCAALSDYIPEKQKGKISSGEKNKKLVLKNATKVIPIIKKKAPKACFIAFKAESEKQNLKKASINLIKKYDLNLVIANLTAGFESDKNEIWIYNKKGLIANKKDKKEKLADFILNTIIKECKI